MGILNNPIHEGERLKEIIYDRRIKIIHFAEMAGFSNQIAHYYFRKETIKRSTLMQFCDLLAITLEIFYNWDRRKDETTGNSFHHGNHLKLLLEKNRVNKSELPKSMLISRRTLYNLFDTTVFSPKQMFLVCKGLGITENEFMGVKEGGDERQEGEYSQLQETESPIPEESSIQDDRLDFQSEDG